MRWRYLALLGTSVLPFLAYGQDGEKKFEVYGFAQMDYIQDFKRVNPAWDDTLRPSRIPTEDGKFGSDGQAMLSVKQSRFGIQGTLPVEGGDLKTKFEIDMFGVGVDEGQTTIRLRHVYGEYGNWLAGQTNSLFMDIDMFPNTIDYWGPNGMVFLRTPQIRYNLSKGETDLSVAIEKPAGDIDPGQLRNVDPSFGGNSQGDEKMPDLTFAGKMNRDWGYLRLGGIARRLGFETAGVNGNKPKGAELGWGLNFSSNIKFGDDTLRVSTVYGQGIANYMNDGGTDLSATGTLANPEAKAVPLLGLVAYYDHYWSKKYSSSIGYARTQVENTSLQNGDAFKTGQYASTNILYYPAKNVMIGGEVLWGSRQDKDGAYGEDIRTQISFKYSFSSLD